MKYPPFIAAAKSPMVSAEIQKASVVRMPVKRDVKWGLLVHRGGYAVSAGKPGGQ